ncbi:unnamed protein product [Psylliodes chrysocephalus]|uniref:Uncharacterized protein n=1 Tax=Psylliodes chrysocephalus TaxID=3402493 RepID=A0A9P0CX06_9CUCU|nr:unnamed protein product [Psylliodes chrysocephala]
MNRSRILRKDRCADSNNREGHVGKNLREFSSPQKITFPDFPVGSMICYKCRDMFEEERNLTRTKVSGIDNSISSSEIPNTSNLSNVSAEISLNNNNNIAESNTLDPSGSSLNLSLNSKENDFDNMMGGLKDKFSSLHVHDPDRIAILIALPTSWSIDKIAKEFSTTHYAVRKAKDLKNRTVLSQDQYLIWVNL